MFNCRASFAFWLASNSYRDCRQNGEQDLKDWKHNPELWQVSCQGYNEAVEEIICGCCATLLMRAINCGREIAPRAGSYDVLNCSPSQSHKDPESALWGWTNGYDRAAANDLVSVKTRSKFSFCGSKTWPFSYSVDHLWSSALLVKNTVSAQVLWALTWKETCKETSHLEVRAFFSSCTGMADK